MGHGQGDGDHVGTTVVLGGGGEGGDEKEAHIAKVGHHRRSAGIREGRGRLHYVRREGARER